jgi:D12 class N6 adenine-specific DNA methyltransferase
MTGAAGRTFFAALLPYLGGKRRLAPLIFAVLNESLGREQWSESLFLDAFFGGGAVGLFAKAVGFHVVASDIAERAMVSARALIANSSVRLRCEDVLSLFVPAPAHVLAVAAAHMPAMFSAAQAAWIDGAMAAATRHGEPVRSLLRLVVIKAVLRMFPMALPTATDAAAVVRGDFDAITPRRLAHYLSARDLLTPERIWVLGQAVNQGVFGGRGEVMYTDALTALRTVPVHVACLDAPYPRTSGYAPGYRLIDHLLGDDAAEQATVPTIDELMDAARAVPVVVISYGGPTTTLEELVTLVGRHRRVERSLAVSYPHLRPLTSEVKNGTNQEFIVVARRR